MQRLALVNYLKINFSNWVWLNGNSQSIGWNWLYFIVLLMRIKLIIANVSTQYSLRFFQSPNTHTHTHETFASTVSDWLPTGGVLGSQCVSSMEWMLASVTYLTEGAAYYHRKIRWTKKIAYHSKESIKLIKMWNETITTTVTETRWDNYIRQIILDVARK